MHPILLVGAALVGLPILLHLIMKQEPKRLPFPAFRFLKQKLKSNQRKLRLRHFLLLAMRMLLIALFALTLYQPMLLSERLNLRGEQPLAVVVVLDTSPSMGYLVGDKTRLDDAKKRVLELLNTLPDKSSVAVVDTSELSGTWGDIAAARRRLEEIQEPSGGAQPVTSALAVAYQLLRTVDQETDAAEPMPRLVAVFTDRAAGSWDAARVEDLKKLRDGIPDPKPAHAVVDVGVDQPANVAILSVDMKPQVVAANQPATVNLTLGAVGPGADAVVKAFLDDAPQEPKVVPVAGGQTRAVTYTFKDLKPGLHQLRFELERKDNLPADNTRFFTFRVGEGRKILTITDEPDDARFWALAHEVAGEFENTTVKPEAVKSVDDLRPYEVVTLLNVARPNLPADDPLWAKLQRYVDAGGKLVVIPGGKDHISLDDYDPEKVQAANQLMPGKFKPEPVNTRTFPPPADPKAPDRRDGVAWAIDGDRVLDHPMLRPFREWQRVGNVNFLRNPRKAWTYWEVEKNPQANVVVSYDDADDPKARRPAVLERDIGKGRVMLLTTRMDDPWDRDREWHDYWDRTDNSWSFVFPLLVMKYLAGDSAEANFNYPTGQTVTVPLRKGGMGKGTKIEFDGPGIVGRDAIVEPTEKQTELKVGPPKTNTPGNFKLKAGDWAEGFSLNVPADESNLDKVPVAAVEDLTGPDTVLAVDRELNLRDAFDVKFNQPVDLFPWLLILVLVLLAAEGLVANRFYRRPGGK